MKILIQKAKKSKIKEVDFANLPFGKIMTDHMALVEYKDGKWGDAKIVPYENLSLSPSISALHYGQAVFEGMKAYKNKKGEVLAFRINAHAKRLNKSLSRLAMPEIPEEMFTEIVMAYLKTEKDWVPDTEGASLYIRPFVFATEAEVGLRPSSTYTFCIFGCPSGPYYSKSLKVKIEDTFSRSAPGGMGFAKAAGNYAASMLPTQEAIKQGFDQLLWTDAATHSYLEESGTMNAMFVIGDILVTPEAGETILAGITRDSILTLAKDLKIKVETRKISVKELTQALEKGKISEAFGTGTAATIAPIKSISFKNKEYKLVNEKEGPVGSKLHKLLTDIKFDEAPDKYKWVTKI